MRHQEHQEENLYLRLLTGNIELPAAFTIPAILQTTSRIIDNDGRLVNNEFQAQLVSIDDIAQRFEILLPNSINDQSMRITLLIDTNRTNEAVILDETASDDHVTMQFNQVGTEIFAVHVLQEGQQGVYYTFILNIPEAVDELLSVN